MPTMKYYVYRHIRPDKNEPLYIGLAKKAKKFNTIKNEYARAYAHSKDHRTEFWHNIFNLCNKKIEVDILYESDDWKEINEKEIEFIKLYGRADLGLGPLVNFTNGGEGNHGTIVTEETRRKRSESMKGKNTGPITEEHRQNLIKSHLGYSPTEEHRKNLSIAGKKRYEDPVARLVMSQRMIGRVFTEEWKQNGSKARLKFMAENPGHWESIRLINDRAVVKLTLAGEFVQEYKSLREAAKENGMKSSSGIGAVVRKVGNNKTAYGFRWAFKENFVLCPN